MLQVKGNLFDFFQIWTIPSLVCNKEKRVCDFFSFFSLKYLFFKSAFCTIIFCTIFLVPFEKFCNFSLKLNMANRRHALGPENSL